MVPALGGGPGADRLAAAVRRPSGARPGHPPMPGTCPTGVLGGSLRKRTAARRPWRGPGGCLLTSTCPTFFAGRCGNKCPSYDPGHRLHNDRSPRRAQRGIEAESGAARQGSKEGLSHLQVHIVARPRLDARLQAPCSERTRILPEPQEGAAAAAARAFSFSPTHPPS